jgi:Xaa-Pro dipeptidase
MKPMEPFSTLEFEQRVERARAAMTASRLDGLLITSEANFRYFTGFDSQTWISPTRPRYFVLPRNAPPVAIVPASNLAGMRATSWISDVRTWQAPNPSDDGISLVASALGECRGSFDAIGAEIGPESRLAMPVTDFLRLRQMLQPIDICDGVTVMSAVRMIKSSSEIDRIRRAAHILSDGFAVLPTLLREGATEREICSALHIDLIRRGADKVPYLVGVSGRGGYDNTNIGPTDRILTRGDILYIDGACTVDGYFCDFDRHFSFGPLSSDARRVFDAVYHATDVGIAAVRPGQRTCDVWQAMADSLSGLGCAGANIGRMGHGVGLLLTEAPSVSPNDHTVLRPGMVLSIEPGATYAPAVDGTHKITVHEENIVITETGVELLSRRAPADMPIIS